MKRTFIALATALAVGAGSLSPVYADVRAKTSETQAPSDNKLSGDVKDKSSGVIDSKKMEKSTQDLLDKQDGSMKSSAGQDGKNSSEGTSSKNKKGSSPTGSSPIDLLLISGVVGLLVVKGLQTLRLDPATFPPELQGLIRFIFCGSLPELLPQSGDNEFDLGIQKSPLGVPTVPIIQEGFGTEFGDGSRDNVHTLRGMLHGGHADVGGEHGVTNEIQGKKSLRPGETLRHEDAHGMLSEPLHVGERLRVLEYGDVQTRVFFTNIPGGFRPIAQELRPGELVVKHDHADLRGGLGEARID